MNFQDEELLNDYITECREHLADIETQLLAMEMAGANIDDALVNKVFRAAHSIKGGAGLIDIPKIKELAHKTENVLGMIRSKTLAPSSEVINVLLLAFDRLRNLVNNVKSINEIDISEIVVALQGLCSTGLPSAKKPSLRQAIEVPIPASTRGHSIRATAFDFDQAQSQKQTVYLLEFDFPRQDDRNGKTPLEVIAKLSEHGTILECTTEQLAAGPLICVLFASMLNAEQVTRVCPLPARTVRGLDAKGLARQGQAAPDSSPKVAADGFFLVEPPSAQSVESSPGTLAGSALPSDSRLMHPEFPEESRVGQFNALVSGKDPVAADTTLRVNVTLLEFLMNLAGELVLSRNQLNEAIAHDDLEAIRSGSHRISAVTSELQQTIVQTRLQPIGNILGRLPRVVRNLARQLGKEVQLEIVGRDVEMDKTIIEGLSEPLTHMVRNAVDHGIETPEQRRACGKRPVGLVQISASHEAGQVVVDITDDGRGLDPQAIAASAIDRRVVTLEQVRQMTAKELLALVLVPGVSTARQVTDLSGRGVGMDVVKSNLDSLSGKLEIESELGKGTLFRVKLPLTLAIIPSLLISVGGERFAIPQVNVNELLRIPAAQVSARFETVGGAEVLMQRGELIPVVHLGEVLGIARRYVDSSTGEAQPERRTRMVDRRASRSPGDSTVPPSTAPERRASTDRRYRAASDVNIAIVSASSFRFGLVVDELHDTLEIVVKPLGRHLKRLREYAGATILGDGTVALILDVSGLAAKARLNSARNAVRAQALALENKKSRQEEPLSLLMFRNGPQEQCAVPLAQVARVEMVTPGAIENIAGRKTLRYRGASLPLVSLGDAVKDSETMASDQELVVIVFEMNGREMGLLGAGPVDAVDVEAKVDRAVHRQKGILGSTVVREKTTLIVDLMDLVEAAYPDWVMKQAASQVGLGSGRTVLLAEDSEFFRGQVRKYIENGGYRVLCAEDGQAAWQMLSENAGQIQLLVTDVEMPRMNGLELTRQVRGDRRFHDLPVVALSSLAGEDDMARGMAAGVTEYLVKLDGEKLVETIRRLLGEGPVAQA